jgi:hypothetical protein
MELVGMTYPAQMEPDAVFDINSANQALQWKDGRVLVVSWMSKSSYESNYKNQTHTAPQF